MIDYYDMQNQPPSHYEYEITRNFKAEKQVKINVFREMKYRKHGQQVKKKIFREMKDLEGWCTYEKASVLMDIIFEHRPDVVVEIGVWGGKSFIPMAAALQYLGKGMIYGIDPWKSEDSIVGFDDANTDWWSKVNHEKIKNGFLNKLHQLHLTDYSTIIEASSADAPLIGRIDMIHIDGNHSEASALYDVKKWVPHVKKGGYIIFDDVDWPTTAKAVKWLNEHCTHVSTYHGMWGIWIKK